MDNLNGKIESKNKGDSPKSGWVLQLKGNSSNAMYFDGEDLVEDISDSLIIKCKDKYIEFMKNHEERMFEEYGFDAICNAGYTNMMKNFEFVEVEYILVNEDK